MATIGLSEAARLTGAARSTLYRAIKTGRLSAASDASGAVRIDPAELARVFKVATPRDSGETLRETSRYNPRPAELVARIAELEARLSEKNSLIAAHERAIDDLRRRLDAEAEERRRLTAILTDQRAAVPDSVLRPSPWWRRRFGRRR